MAYVPSRVEDPPPLSIPEIHADDRLLDSLITDEPLSPGCEPLVVLLAAWQHDVVWEIVYIPVDE